MKKKILFCIGIASATLLIPAMRAQLYQVQINGTLNQIHGTGFWDASIQNGIPMTAIFTCDASASPAASFATNVQWYFNATPNSLSVGDYTFTSAEDHFVIYNNDANFGDGYSFDSVGVSGGPTLYNEMFAARLWDYGIPTSTILSDMAQPVQIFPLTVFHEVFLTITGFTDPSLNSAYLASLTAYQTVTSYTITAIPEPSTYAALFGLTALGFAAYRRRRSRVG